MGLVPIVFQKYCHLELKYIEWLYQMSDTIVKSIKVLGPKKLETLKKGITFGGEFSLGDFEYFGFKTTEI